MLVPFVCLLFWCEYARADSLQVWHPRNPLPTQYALRGVAYGNGTYVTVGVLGTILNSSNGIDWATCNSGTTQQLNAVTFGKGRFVVGGNAGLMLWSTNGVNWTNASVPVATHDIDGLGYGTGTNFPDGLFVAMVSSNRVNFGNYDLQGFYSSNAVDWYLWTPPPFLTSEAPHRSVTIGNNTFVASFIPAAPDIRPRGTFYSSSGSTWKTTSDNTAGAVTYGNGLFVMAESIVTTTNGLALNYRTTTNPAAWSGMPFASQSIVQAACFGGGKFIFVGASATVAVSTDATNWLVARILPSTPALRAVTYGDGLYVAVGTGGMIVTSPDATNWTVRTKGMVWNLNDVSPADDGFVAVGQNGAMITSSNGAEWQVVPALTSNALLAVVRAGGSYVASDTTGGIFSGPNSSNMAARASNITVALNGLGYGAGTFVAVGSNGTILSSSDSIDWSSRNSGTTNHLFAVEFGNDRFVAVGNLGTILTSTDGVTWVTQVSGTGLQLRDVAYGRGRFVAKTSGVNLGVFHSVDGVVWEAATSFPIPYSSTGKIAFGNGWFFGSFLVSNNLLASRDGRNWSLLSLGTNIFQPSVLAYNNGTFVNVYSYGVISQSDPVVQVEISHDGLAHLTVGGPKNATYRIESLDALAATNLWQPLTVLSNAPYVWVDPQSPGSTNRIYRAVLLQ